MEFRRRFSRRRPAVSKEVKSEGISLSADLGFKVAVAIATALVVAMASLAFADLDGLLASLAAVAFMAVYLCWRALDNASWQIDDTRYLIASAEDPEIQRERWYSHHAIKILKADKVTAEQLTYLHAAAERAAALSGRKIAYIAGILTVVAGWWYLLFEADFENYTAAASALTKIVISVYLMGGAAIFAPVFLQQRFSSIDRIIENTLYDLIKLGLYEPSSGDEQGNQRQNAIGGASAEL